jgi:hypothetical protein
MPLVLSGDGITSDNITSLAASKLTGQLPDANAPSGSVIQVVTSVYSTRQSFSATLGTYYDTGLTATITPTSSTSKILVLVTATHQSAYNSTTNAGSALGLKRGGTRIAGFVGSHVATVSNAENIAPTGNIVLLDSPATTSAVTYTTLITAVAGSTLVWFNGTYGQTGFDAFITLMEIAA